MSSPPPSEESLSVFAELRYLAERRRYIQEIERPQLPKTWQPVFEQDILYLYGECFTLRIIVDKMDLVG